jgi:TRAP-type mannitol/chloroaromatic compound transport system permease small subunit
VWPSASFEDDKVTAWVGKAFAWCIMIMTLGVSYEVFVRYLLRDPTSWAFDVSYMMYGTLFMMAGAYTLSRDGHVRGDVVFRLWKPKVQATIELVLYLIFFYPAVLALIIAGFDYAGESWFYQEVSVMSPANVPIFQFKTITPVAGMLLFIQGLAQCCRCLICLKTGEWPQHLEDVEEMETVLAHQYEDVAQAQAALGLGPAEGDK